MGFSREGRLLWLLSFPIALAGLDVRITQVHLLFTLLTGLLFGSWLLRPLFRIPALHTQVYAPARVVVGAPTRFEIELSNPGQQALSNLQLVLPFLPWDGRWTSPPGGVARLSGGARATVSAHATFQARGEHHLDRFRVGQVVPLGLAIGSLVESDGARFLVVPRPAHVVSLAILRTLPEGHGAFSPTNERGENEFTWVRPYRYDDPIKHLHVRTWARTGEPHVRELVDERDTRIGLVLELAIDPKYEFVGEAALSLAAGIAARLTMHGDGLDVLICNGSQFPIQPRTGQAALDRVLDHLATYSFRSTSDCSRSAGERILRESTSAVLLSTGRPELQSAMVARLRNHGASFKWVQIVDETGEHQDLDDPHLEAQRVSVEAIESGEPIEL